MLINAFLSDHGGIFAKDRVELCREAALEERWGVGTCRVISVEISDTSFSTGEAVLAHAKGIPASFLIPDPEYVRSVVFLAGDPAT